MNNFKDVNPGSTVGIKLDIGFSMQQSYRALYGNHSIPKYLAELGFTAVETPVGLETDRETLKQHVICCCNAGLKTSLHAYSEGTVANPAFFSLAQNNARRVQEVISA
jgi:hypothetical protein